MANFTNTGTTGYPGVIDTRTALTDGATGDVIVANHPNGLGAAVLALETELGTDPAGSVVDVKTRLAVALNDNGTVKSSVISAGAGITTSYASGVFTINSVADGPGNLQNIGLEIVANAPIANTLRVRLVQQDGSTLTSTNSGQLIFHAASSTSALYNTVFATQDTVASLSAGSTLGFAAGEFGRFYIWAINANAGAANSVVELALSRKATFQEMQLWTTTAEGSAGAADDADTLYSTTARTNVPVRCLGYVDITTGATAGNWTNQPTRGTLMGAGSKRTGDVVQIVATYTGIVKTGTTATVNDDTVPLSAEGDPYLWATLTATSEVNTNLIEGQLIVANAAPARPTMFVCTQSSGHAIVSSRLMNGTVNATSLIHLLIATPCGTTAARGYYLIAGDSGAGTMTLNGESGARVLGGSLNSYLRLTEIMA